MYPRLANEPHTRTNTRVLCLIVKLHTVPTPTDRSPAAGLYVIGAAVQDKRTRQVWVQPLVAMLGIAFVKVYCMSHCLAAAAPSSFASELGLLRHLAMPTRNTRTCMGKVTAVHMSS